MKNAFIEHHLPKLGNLKIGANNGGQVAMLNKILVTAPTKKGNENFITYPGFSENGEESITVSLPYNDNDLNFEVGYVAFVTINEVDYFGRCQGIGTEAVFAPINLSDADKPTIKMDKLSKYHFNRLSFELSGLLRVMVEGVSSFGEVFFFKTKSLNTIRTLQSQLSITKTLLGGKIANVPLKLRAIEKEAMNGNAFTYLSIGVNRDALRAYNETYKSDDIDLSFDGVEALIKETRGNNTIEFVSKKHKIEKIDSIFEPETVDISSNNEILETALNSLNITDQSEIEALRAVFNEKTINLQARYLLKLKETNADGYVNEFLETIGEMETVDLISFVGQ